MVRQRVVRLGVVLALAFAAASVQANVSLRNGNFFIGYTDIFYPGGPDTKVERVCNSKSSFHGPYGHCWGTEFATFLTVTAEGSVIVHEFGGGAENRFNPIAFNQAELEKAAEAIANVAKSAGAVGTPAQLASYQKRLKEDAQFRNREWETFRVQGKIQPRQLPIGSQLHSNRFSYQYITRVAGGYLRNFDTGRVEKFDEAGRLTRISDKNGNFQDFTYSKDGHLAKIVDNFNRKIFFTFNAQGFVERMEGENGKKAEYRYNDKQELVYSKDVDGNIYTYKYDQNHNMTEIGYVDKTTMAMTYYGADQFQNIKSVKERDGTLTEYTYQMEKGDRSHYQVGVTVKSPDGRQISSSSYEYFMKRKADGEEWTQRLITTLDGDRTDTTYNECCGLPMTIKHGNEETRFEYDAKGHVTRKDTPAEVTELAYDQKVGKVTKVTRYPKTDKKRAVWSAFQYDEKGNLVFAQNSEKKGVKLFYDGNGRIKSMIDNDRRRIDFKYNENSKPVEITDPALGTINVSYSNSGEIRKVESTAGRRIALQVTSAFQKLLDIIKPAGVTLTKE